MFKHYFATALRNFRRFKSATLIKVCGLALGLACFIAAFGAITFLQSGELHFKNADRIVVIGQRGKVPADKFDSGLSIMSAAPVPKYLRLDFPELEAVSRSTWIGELMVSTGERMDLLDGRVVDPEFLTIFDLPFIHATESNPLKDPGGVVLSKHMATRLFGSIDILGRRLTVNGKLDATVTGVIESNPQSSQFGGFDLVMNRDTARALRARNGTLPPDRPEAEQWGQVTGLTYALLPADGSLDRAELNSRLRNFSRHATGAPAGISNEFHAIPLSSVTLTELNNDLFGGSGLSITWLLMSLAGLVLGVACVNYANLTIAQVLTRHKELGLRRVLGASRGQVVMQHIVESSLQLVSAFALAIMIVVATALSVQPDESTSWSSVVASSAQFWVLAIATLIVLACALAAYTAFIALKTYPIHALRGSTIRSGTGTATRWLIGLQFAVASMLVIGMLVVQLQNSELRNIGPRSTSDPTVLLGEGWRVTNVKYETLRQELLRDQSIVAVSSAGMPPWETGGGISMIARKAGSSGVRPIFTHVNYDFENAMSMRLLAGRSFDPAFADEQATDRKAERLPYSMVIDRSMAEELGWQNPGDAIDQLVYEPTKMGEAPVAPVRIIGVVENKALRLETLNGSKSNVFVLSPKNAGGVIVRVSKDRLGSGLATIDATWKRLVPQLPVQRTFMDERFEKAYALFARVNQMLTILTGIGAGIAAMGLFGMAMFIANRRAHEIGVRKTLGASMQRILTMLLRDFSKPVVIANLLIWPLAYLFAQKYLNLFVNRIPLTPLPFVLSLLAALLIAWIAVGGQAIRAARMNPATVLRHE